MKFKNFGIRLGDAIASAKLSQADVARRLKTSPSLVSRWKNEEILPSMSSCRKLSQILNISIEWLLTGETAGDTSNIKDSELEITNPEEERMFLKELVIAQAEIIDLQKQVLALREQLATGGAVKNLQARGRNGS